MPFDIHDCVRIESGSTPIWIAGDRPVWFVPTRPADRILQALQTGAAAEDSLDTRRLLGRLPDTSAPPAVARQDLLTTDRLEEFWLHVTQRCNLACSHCLFNCSGSQARQLDLDRIAELAGQAFGLGCRLFALTGGEPFVHPQICQILSSLLGLDESVRAVVLTNGMRLKKDLGWLVDLPADRLHLQVSVDGLGDQHDRIRGAGTFQTLTEYLDRLGSAGPACTVSMCVDRENLDQMPAVVDYAADRGAAGVHFMWYFVAGRGAAGRVPDCDRLAEALIAAAERAEARQLPIDNLEAMRSQLFTPPGTRHDGSTAGWKSLAVGADGKLYPSAALVGREELATEIGSDLPAAWRDSAVLQRVRAAGVGPADADPWRYLLGGGDSDHRYIHSGRLDGPDPYLPMKRRVAAWLIARQARPRGDSDQPQLRLKMGDRLVRCHSRGPIGLVHNNCLLSAGRADGRTEVADFYNRAARATRSDILNPVGYAEAELAHVPEDLRFRGYGCGSPVSRAQLTPGQAVVDLGCGTGIECFIAARAVGPTGHVIGVDMLDAMLRRARAGARRVCERLGYNNLGFEKGYLESLPLADASADVVLSNCVLNLSMDKRQCFAEIRRVLRPGGRLVASDVTCDEDPGPGIRNDPILRGECIGGALTLRDLVGLLAESGLTGLRILGRFPYRTVAGHPFYSVTFEARRPAPRGPVRVLYPGPGAGLITPDGTFLPPGVARQVAGEQVEALDTEIFRLDRAGAVTDRSEANVCCCGPAPAPAGQDESDGCCHQPDAGRKTHASGCLLCGGRLEYLSEQTERICDLCGKPEVSAMACREGHFVCNTCHGAEAADAIQRICRAARTDDMLELMGQVRAHPSMAMHGPEHHAMVPAVILAACGNSGMELTDTQIARAVGRGLSVAGGSCGYLGTCGAAVGVGIALGILLDSSPVVPDARQAIQSAVAETLAIIASHRAARCCRRDCSLALQAAAEIIPRYLPARPRAAAVEVCDQIQANPECLGPSCPLHPARLGQTTPNA